MKIVINTSDGNVGSEYLMEMYSEGAAGHLDPAEPRTAETTTRTSLQKFSRQVIKPAVDAARPRETAGFPRLH